MMPTISIDIRKKYPREIEIMLINAVYIACKHAFKLPDHDRDIRLNIHEPHLFLCPTNLTQPEYFNSNRLLFRALSRSEKNTIPINYSKLICFKYSS